MKFSTMLSTTVSILISVLFANGVHVLAKNQFPCSKPLPYCSCVNIGSDKIDYTCEDDQNNVVSLFCNSPTEMKITCDYNTTSKEWYKLLKDVDLSEDYDVLTIQRCPIPAKSIKDILAQLSVGIKIKTLIIDNTPDPENNYRADHFRGLDSLFSFYFRRNNVTSFSEDALSGLSNLRTCLLNENNLQKISPKFFQHVPKVIFLDLSGNDLTTLEADTFEPLKALHTLNLNHNKLTNLSREVFTPLRTLVRLDLSGNDITTFNEDVFRDLTKLEVLSINFNNISVLSDEIIRDLKSLKSFKAMQSFNKNMTTIPSGLFSGSKMLQEIKIERNGLTYLPESIFEGLNNLSILSLFLNRLRELPPALFETTTNLRKIDLSFNKLTRLSETTFRGLTKLVELNLDHNEIAFIHGNAFDDLGSLKQLRLANNRLSHLQAGVFDHLRELEVIFLDSNKLDMSSGGTTSDSVLSHCVSLQEMHLRNNSIDHIFPDWLLLPINLHILDLSYNKLENLETSSLNFLQAYGEKSIWVNLEYNNITTFRFGDYERLAKYLMCPDGGSCSNLKHDVKISIRDNPIKCDCKNYDFIRLIQRKMNSLALGFVSVQNKEELRCYQPKHMSNVKLVEVDLANLYCLTSCPGGCTCQFRPIDRVTVVNCTNVDELPTWLPNNTEIELILAHNRLKNLQKISPLITPNVTKLSLSWNSLENIDDLVVLPSLKVLQLDHNKISVLGENTIEMLNSTRARIYLHDNPWKCDCDAKYLMNFIEYRFSEFLMPDANRITCDYTGQVINQLSAEVLCSKSVYLYITCLTLAAFGIIFGILTIVYLQYEHEIKVFMFAHKICLWLVTEKEVDRDKEYDVFISYAHQDEEFVVKHLIPNLETGPHPYKLCLHYRSFIVGDPIPEQIVRCVNSSRRTIIVLTRSYLESRWANLEFRTAYSQTLKERHARLIIILLEDLDPNVELDPELKAYITMNTYLKWGDYLFWDKLRYALPHPQHYRKLKSTKTKTKIFDHEHRKKLIEAFRMKNSESAKINDRDMTCC